MRSPRFEITRLLLTVPGFLILVAIGVRLIRSPESTPQAIGWGVIVLLLVAVVGMLRPSKG